jgi:hypothetical protein
MSAYNLCKEQFGEYLPGLAPEQDDLEAMGYQTVYRGVKQNPREGVEGRADLNLEQVGNHWSSDRSVARSFASNLFYPGYILEGKVHPDDVEDLEHNTVAKTYWERKGVFTWGSGKEKEKEVTLKPDAKVRVSKLTKIKDVGNLDPSYVEKPVVNFRPTVATAAIRGTRAKA